MNRHERRKAAASTPRAMRFMIGGVEMTITPATIERVYTQWQKETGRPSREMSSEEFSKRMMDEMIENARPMQTGNA